MLRRARPSTTPSLGVPPRSTPSTIAASCALLLGDTDAALTDLEMVVAKDSDHDFHRAAGMLAQAYALSGQKDKAEVLFRQVHSHVNAVRDLSELCRSAGLREPRCRGPRVGAEGTRQGTNDAALPHGGGSVRGSGERANFSSSSLPEGLVAGRGSVPGEHQHQHHGQIAPTRTAAMAT